ncbi:MAG: radical SAM protein [archaeon]
MKKIIKITKGIPLLGAIAFGIIDRGTDLLQVRPTSICNLNCIYCSTDSGPKSKIHQADYVVDLDYLMEYVKDAVEYKETSVEVNIDSVGDPLTYKQIAELIKKTSKIKNVRRISMQTNGTLLTPALLDKLEKAGLNQINLSVNTLDAKQGKYLSGTDCYDLKKVLAIAKKVAEPKIELLLAPVWIPGINDKGIEEMITLSKELKCKIGIQKYEIYKYSRKVPKIKAINYWKFYDKIEEWEKKYKVKLKLTAKDMKIKKAKRLPEKFKKGEKEYAEIKCLGWIKGQMIGVARNRSITVNNCNSKIGDKVKVKILETKNNLYLAETI